MRNIRFLWPLLAWVACLGGITQTSPHARVPMVSQSVGVAFSNPFVRAKSLAYATGLGFGASLLLEEWQQLRSPELRDLLADSEI